MLLALKNNLGHWWNNLINIGVKPTTPEWYRKRIRIINGISVYAIIIFTAFTIGYAFGDFKATFYESLVATILYLVTLAINKWGSFDFCRVFFVIFNALLFFYFAVSFIYHSFVCLFLINHLNVVILVFLIIFHCFYPSMFDVVSLLAIKIAQPNLFYDHSILFYTQDLFF